jgi:hypothetical protein
MLQKNPAKLDLVQGIFAKIEGEVNDKLKIEDSKYLITNEISNELKETISYILKNSIIQVNKPLKDKTIESIQSLINEKILKNQSNEFEKHRYEQMKQGVIKRLEDPTFILTQEQCMNEYHAFSKKLDPYLYTKIEKETKEIFSEEENLEEKKTAVISEIKDLIDSFDTFAQQLTHLNLNFENYIASINYIRSEYEEHLNANSLTNEHLTVYTKSVFLRVNLVKSSMVKTYALHRMELLMEEKKDLDDEKIKNLYKEFTEQLQLHDSKHMIKLEKANLLIKSFEMCLNSPYNLSKFEETRKNLDENKLNALLSIENLLKDYNGKVDPVKLFFIFYRSLNKLDLDKPDKILTKMQQEEIAKAFHQLMESPENAIEKKNESIQSTENKNLAAIAISKINSLYITYQKQIGNKHSELFLQEAINHVTSEASKGHLTHSKIETIIERYRTRINKHFEKQV